MDAVRLEPINKRHIRSFHQALDAVARERRFLALTQAPPLEAVTGFVHDVMHAGFVQLVALAARDQVVGWCDIRRKTHDAVFAHVGILGMGVLAAYRHQGLGRRLLEAALAQTDARGVERVELEVFASNTPAVALYESVGFVHEGRKQRAANLDGRFEDIVSMARLR